MSTAKNTQNISKVKPVPGVKLEAEKKSAWRKRQVADREDTKPNTRKKPANDESEDDLKKFTCSSCEREYFDTNLYFYGTKSTRCLWCTKFPRVKTRQVD
jgi:hypothetical protein